MELSAVIVGDGVEIRIDAVRLVLSCAEAGQLVELIKRAMSITGHDAARLRAKRYRQRKKETRVRQTSDGRKQYLCAACGEWKFEEEFRKRGGAVERRCWSCADRLRAEEERKRDAEESAARWAERNALRGNEESAKKLG